MEKIKINGLSEQIEYLGTRDNAMEFIYSADVFVLPSLAEAMPCVILEAMALKTPVISSDVDGIPELIEDEVTGFLFSPTQSDSLVDAFKRMATNLDKSKLYAEKAYQKYWQEFSRLRQIERYNKVISLFDKK